MIQELKKNVCQANMDLKAHNLVTCSWGNVSGFDPDDKLVVIKPSGLAYEQLTPENMVVLDLQGRVVEGTLRPSSDAPSHLELYRNFPAIGGVCHTHSSYATMWAQACRAIPCFGTTHADYYYGEVPVTEPMTEEEIKSDYELNTGRVIIRRFQNLEPLQMPAVLVAHHGPFTWGKTPEDAVESAIVLEQIAHLALGTLTLSPQQLPITPSLLDKHYLRKHGRHAYYGQK